MDCMPTIGYLNHFIDIIRWAISSLATTIDRIAHILCYFLEFLIFFSNNDQKGCFAAAQVVPQRPVMPRNTRLIVMYTYWWYCWGWRYRSKGDIKFKKLLRMLKTKVKIAQHWIGKVRWFEVLSLVASRVLINRMSGKGMEWARIPEAMESLWNIDKFVRIWRRKQKVSRLILEGLLSLKGA